ncbi:DICT sensory domain-containing protein [Crocosphaera sp. UHCC 0190]|uniref:DICT sensory domain-containing protein n=1 Tax=Crocosphaera sp. UHCC 0190 TaxID=3110246 RepID=UPI002B1F5DE5|nr:DICT sensory domain-containing protein [Crocosphaera sp. UHCC 0190]MEA5508642.1 DICT sensory domain-containing protein [Crocosphaera sp. UHCC 0190]
MNLPLTPEISLYQLTQTLGTSPSALTIKASTLRERVDSLIQFLLDQQIRATVWAKLPTHPRWWATLEAYQQEGLAEEVYRCTISRGGGTTPSRQTSPEHYSSKDSITPIVLEASSQLKREYFCLILSPQFCSLILAQEQIPSGQEPPSGLLEPSFLKLVYSFDPVVIQRVLTGIKRMITITDITPVELLTDSVLTFPLPSSVDSALLTQLLHRQLRENQLAQESSQLRQDTLPKQPTAVSFLNLGEDFLKTLTRELSIPLTNMKTALRLLESKQHKRELRQRYLDLLKGECDRQNILITGLQELIQLNQPLDETDLTVKLEEVVPGIVSTYQAIAEEKGIILGYTIPPGFPHVTCPGVWLRRILQNLIHNSLKFTPANGRISVQAVLKPEGVELSVSDTGIGIENSDLPRIFDSFYRGRNTLPNTTEGIGLGLAIVRHLVEQSGGKIEVASQVGKGTIFRILFPVELSS